MNNKKILFIVPYPFGQAPSQRFRFEQYLHFLKEYNILYDFVPFLDLKVWKILYGPGNVQLKTLGILKGFIRRFFLMFRMLFYDFVFIHREAAPIGPPVFEWLIAKVLRKKIIYDFDDAIWLPNTSDNNRLAARLKWHKKVAKICKWSYKVSCGNEYLSDFAKKYNRTVILNPTTIDTVGLHNPDLIKVKNRDPEINQEVPIIGWTGSHSTLSYLKPLEPVLQHLEKKYAFIFRVISNHPPDIKIKNIDYVQWNKKTEIEDLGKLDIGLMPLEDDFWGKGKCGFKCLQYMAMGIPSLVSPVGVNTKIIDHGENGFLCKTEEDWMYYIEKLLLDRSLRNRLGEAGRKKVEQHYSVKSNKTNFIDLFN